MISKLCTLSDEFEIPERKCDDNWKKSTQHTHILKVVETPPKPKGTQAHIPRAVRTTTTTLLQLQRHIITEYIYSEQINTCKESKQLNTEIKLHNETKTNVMKIRPKISLEKTRQRNVSQT